MPRPSTLPGAEGLFPVDPSPVMPSVSAPVGRAAAMATMEGFHGAPFVVSRGGAGFARGVGTQVLSPVLIQEAAVVAPTARYGEHDTPAAGQSSGEISSAEEPMPPEAGAGSGGGGTLPPPPPREGATGGPEEPDDNEPEPEHPAEESTNDQPKGTFGQPAEGLPIEGSVLTPDESAKLDARRAATESEAVTEDVLERVLSRLRALPGNPPEASADTPADEPEPTTALAVSEEVVTEMTIRISPEDVAAAGGDVLGAFANAITNALPDLTSHNYPSDTIKVVPAAGEEEAPTSETAPGPAAESTEPQASKPVEPTTTPVQPADTEIPASTPAVGAEAPIALDELEGAVNPHRAELLPHTDYPAETYVSGTEAEVAAWKTQLNDLAAEAPTAVVTGETARLAMYADAGYANPQAVPTPLQVHAQQHPYELRNRHISVVDPSGTLTDPRPLETLGDHPVDMTLNLLFNHEGQPAFGPPGEEVPVDPRVFETHIRNMDGTPVRTFSYGTQFYIDHMLQHPDESTRFQVNEAQMVDFVRAQQAAHPEEFLPDQFYESFRRFNPNIADLHLPL